MRAFLERLYLYSAYAAGGFIVLIAALVLAQVVGRWCGIIVPSVEDFSGYALASASFFGLAYTFRQHKHIRVVVLLHALPPAWQRRLDNIAIVLLLFVVAYLFYSVAVLVYESWAFEELSQGYVAVPLYLMQLGMLCGLLVFVVAVADSAAARLFENFKTEQAAK